MTIFRSALAGFLATFPMTAAMKFMHRQLPWYQRYPLPPRQITMRAARRAGVYGHLDEPQKRAATLVGHFAYGAVAAAPYAAVTDRINLPTVAKGAAYGLFVWSASYLELMPRLGMMAPASLCPRKRNALMIAAHLVWGVSLALVADSLKSREPREVNPSHSLKTRHGPERQQQPLAT